MTKTRFFAHIVFQIVLGIFLMIVTVRLLPITGWSFLPFFCCIYATHSFVTALKMIWTYRALKIIHEKASTIINKDDDEASDSELPL